MEGASLDDIYSNDYTYKDNLKGNPRENLPPSQHDPNSDYQPTPSLDENGTIFCNQNNDHDASNQHSIPKKVDKGNAKVIDNTMEWIPADNLVPLQDNKCTKFFTNYITKYTAVHNIKSDISRVGLMSMIVHYAKS
jgi:hypothetical protein